MNKTLRAVQVTGLSVTVPVPSPQPCDLGQGSLPLCAFSGSGAPDTPPRCSLGFTEASTHRDWKKAWGYGRAKPAGRRPKEKAGRRPKEKAGQSIPGVLSWVLKIRPREV